MQFELSLPYLTVKELIKLTKTSSDLKMQIDWYLASLSSVKISTKLGAAKELEWYVKHCLSAQKIKMDLSNLTHMDIRSLMEAIPTTVRKLQFTVHGDFLWNAKYAPYMYDIQEVSTPDDDFEYFLSIADAQRFPLLESVSIKFHPVSNLTILYRQGDQTEYEMLNMRILRYSELAALARKPSLDERFASVCEQLCEKLPRLEAVKIKKLPERPVDVRATLTNYYNFVCGKILDNSFAQLIYQEN